MRGASSLFLMEIYKGEVDTHASELENGCVRQDYLRFPIIDKRVNKEPAHCLHEYESRTFR